MTVSTIDFNPAWIGGILTLMLLAIGFVIYKKKGDLDIFLTTVIFAIFSLTIFIGYILFIIDSKRVYNKAQIDINTLASFGDSFGFITSFFSIFSTILLVLTISLQYKALKSQQEQLNDTNKAMEEQTKILEAQQENAFLSTFLEHFNISKAPIKGMINDIGSSFRGFTFLEANRLSYEFSVERLLNMIENSLPNLKHSNKTFFSTLTDNEVIFLLLTSAIQRKKFTNVENFIGSNLDHDTFSRMTLNKDINPLLYGITNNKKLENLIKSLKNIKLLLEGTISPKYYDDAYFHLDKIKHYCDLGISNIIEHEICNRTNITSEMSRELYFHEANEHKEIINNILAPYAQSNSHFDFFIKDETLSEIDPDTIDKAITQHLSNTLFKPKPVLE